MDGLRENSVARGVAVLLLLCVVVLYAEGQLDGPCLIDCGKKVVVCAEKCGVDGGDDSCFRECGSKNIDCVNSCMRSNLPPKSNVLMHVEGQQVGQCLIGCGQKVVSCSIDCGIKGGAAVPCYQECGNENIGCVTSCLGTRSMPNDKCD
ncbi:Uncharacterized protein Adt_16531 [Abeliophyllum distichum]|uniref:Uncharacterized protein n=1 Tax=Abeliophyllum distichum TaxID=126358 RepID=A0ABD1TDW5_9LAMI